MTPFLSLFAIGILYSIVFVFVFAVISLYCYKIIQEDNQPLKTVLLDVLKTKLFKLIMQMLVILLITFTVMLGVVLIGVVFGLIFNVLNVHKVFMVIIVIFCYIALISFLIWFYVKVIFCQTAIIIDDASIIGGIKKSFKLVAKDFWRILGIMILLSICVSFASSLITGPIIFVSILPQYLDLLQMIIEKGNHLNEQALIQNFFNSFSNMGLSFGIMIWLSSLAQALVTPLYYTLFYIDLKVRKGEISVDQRTELN